MFNLFRKWRLIRKGAVIIGRGSGGLMHSLRVGLQNVSPNMAKSINKESWKPWFHKNPLTLITVNLQAVGDILIIFDDPKIAGLFFEEIITEWPTSYLNS